MGAYKPKREVDTLQKSVKTEPFGLFTYDERALRREVIYATVFYTFILFWIVCLKFGNAEMLARNYKNLSELTLEERFLWDIVPFYTRQNHTVQWLEFFANSLVFAPFGVLLNYMFAKRNILRDFALCVGLSLSIEIFQLFTLLGGFATVDLIMNSVGYFVGLFIYYLIFKKRSTKTCIWVCRAFNFVFLILFVYALATTIQNGELIIGILTRTL
ncbi:MAG: VanZ family protein [Clostridia bacterium]|nr:VanZ family protein [Clostridia bacterium]